MRINPALQFVREYKETTEIKEVARLLSTGQWIAISATNQEPYLFSLGKVELSEIKDPCND